MDLRRIDVFAFHAPIASPAGNGVTLWRERRAALLRLESGDGHVGLGEAWAPANAVAPVLRALAASASCARDAAMPPQLREAHDDVARACASAWSLALADLGARAAGRPLWAHLGGQARVAVYASGGLYADGKDEGALAAEMAQCAAAGFTRVKMKVGALALDADCRRIAAVRRAVGDPVAVVVDALARHDRHSAIAAVARYAQAGAAAVQAPMPLDDLEGLAALAAASPVPLWLGEANGAPALWRRLAAIGGQLVLQVNPALAGGPAIASLARALGRPVTLQCHATAVLQAACLHLAGAAPQIVDVEYHRFHRHLHELLPTAARHVRDGHVVLDDRPGLGFDLPEDDPRLTRVA